MDKLYDTVVLGGGASGMLCAARLAQAGLSVALAEKNPRLGKKLLATGNGRCNLLNKSAGFYNAEAAGAAARRYPAQFLAELFRDMGVPLSFEGDCAYPASFRSTSVLNALLLALDGAEVFCGFDAVNAVKDGGVFKVDARDGARLSGRTLVLACGSCAGFGDDSLFLAKRLGLGVLPFRPALCPLPCRSGEFSGLNGVRVKTSATLAADKPLWSGRGEILFKENELSGILAFELSYFMARASLPRAVVSLDLLPDLDFGQTEAFIKSFEGRRTADELLGCIFQKMVAKNILNRCQVEKIDAKTAHMLAKTIKQFDIDAFAPKDMTRAQAAFGGIALDGVSSDMECGGGLYAIGEMVDVCGECGGFNLMWAWRSALAASESIVKRKYEK